MRNKIKTKKERLIKSGTLWGMLLGFQLVTPFCIAKDLLITVEESSVSALQQDIQMQTGFNWNVRPFNGTNIELAESVRKQAIENSLPNAAQIPGANIRRWATLGFINQLDDEFNSTSWKQRFPNRVIQDISFRGNTFAVPTQIHRSNWMWLNRDLLLKYSDDAIAPRTWKSFFELLNEIEKNSRKFLITVDDPSQNTLVFESLVLGLHGSEFYSGTLEEFNYQLLKSAEMVNVFEVLSRLRPYLRNPQYDSWESASAALKSGSGSVMFAGDWVKLFMRDEYGQLSKSITCEPLPEASATFLYNLNSVVFFQDTLSSEITELSKVLLTESTLTDLNINAGSIPAQLDITPWGFDQCGVRSMREFRSAHTLDSLRPSLAAGMAASEVVQRSVYDSINAFVNSTSMTPEDGARQLAKAVKVALYRI